MNTQNLDPDFKKNITVTNSIIRIIGVFEHPNTIRFNRDLFKNGFIRENNDESKKFLKNYWYPEFRDLMFLQKEDSSAKIWKKSINEKVVIDSRKSIPFEVDFVELFLFPNGLNFFSLEISIQESNLESYSDLTKIYLRMVLLERIMMNLKNS